ncbi:MAG TPA: TonB-dependent receptor [Rhizomicrobium sp.]|nr:TonB-dependent receptor [Rhizomicrobium sp.]
MAGLAAVMLASAAVAQNSGFLVYNQAFFADSRPSTAYDMVKRLPGFTFDGGETARGFAGTAGNVLIDGQRPTSKSDGLETIITRIPASEVERIEIIRGGAPGIDMQGQTVVANIIRKKADSTSVVATLEDNLFKDGHHAPGAKLEITHHEGGAIYEGSVQLFSNFDDSVGHGTRDVIDASGAPLDHDSVFTRAAAGGVSIHGSGDVPLFGGRFKANLTLQNSPFRDLVAYRAPSFALDFNDDVVERSGELGLHWVGDIGKVNLEVLGLQRLDHTNSRSTADDGTTFDDFDLITDTGESILRGTARYLPVPELTLEGGGEAAFNYLIGETTFLENGVSLPIPSANARVQEHRGEVFGQGTWKMSDSLLLEAGMRFEFSTISETGAAVKQRSFSYPKPRAVLTWSLNPDNQFRFRYERIVGQLDFSNFVASADLQNTGVSSGNEDIRPDQRTQYEVSYETHFWDKGAFVISATHEEIKDVVDLLPVTDPKTKVQFDAPGNIGDGTNDKLDLTLTLPLDQIGLTNGLLKTTATLQHPVVTDPTTHQKRIISGERPQTINVTLTQDIESLKSTWGIQYYNCWEEDYYRLALTYHRRVIPPYLVLFWDYKPTSDWALHFELNNVIPFIYERVQDNYKGPRDISALDNVETLRLQSQPRVFLQIRKSFE